MCGSTHNFHDNEYDCKIHTKTRRNSLIMKKSDLTLSLHQYSFRNVFFSRLVVCWVGASVVGSNSPTFAAPIHAVIGLDNIK